MRQDLSISTKRQVTLDGLMTLGMLENGLKTADFLCCEDVELEAFSGIFSVQAMRDGNIYMQQKPKRMKNKPIYRDDNASFTRGKDGKYYFFFAMDEERIAELPEQLVRQASAIAQKVIRELICN